METSIQRNGFQQKWIHQSNPFNSSKHISVEKLLASVDATPNHGPAATAAKRGRSRSLVLPLDSVKDELTDSLNSAMRKFPAGGAYLENINALSQP